MKRLFAVVLMSVICISGCARFRAGEEANTEFRTADRFISEKKYGEAVVVYEKIAKDLSGTEQGANALFAAASTKAFYDNPHKDYAMALQEFDEFIRTYPDSEKAHDAQNWKYLLKQLIELKKENEHLIQSINELKKIDIRHEERRKGK